MGLFSKIIVKKNQIETEQMRFNMEELRRALGKIKTTKSPGLDMMKPIYIKSILGTINEERILKKLLQLINKIMKGKFNEIIAPHFSVSKGIPIAKKMKPNLKCRTHCCW